MGRAASMKHGLGPVYSATMDLRYIMQSCVGRLSVCLLSVGYVLRLFRE